MNDADLLALARAALANMLATGAAQSLSIQGRAVTYVSLAELRKLIAELEAKIESARSGGFTGFGLGRPW